MAHLEWWKFAVDLLLMGSLAYLCLRFLRAPQTAKLSQNTIELEQTLRTLIRDAEDAGQALNDQLRNRQDSLEKVLAEIEGAERRVKRLLIEVAQGERGATITRDTEVRQSATDQTDDGYLTESPAPEPPSFEPLSSRDRSRTLGNGRLAERIERSANPAPSPVPTNIYGEPLSPPASRAPAGAVAAYRSAGARSTAHSIGETPRERSDSESVTEGSTVTERGTEDGVTGSENSAMDEVYKAAEQLLRAGKDLSYVSARTELPMEEVRVLKQIIIREQAAAASRLAAQSVRPDELLEDETPKIVSQDDPRLGVLTAARRTSTTATA